MFKKGFSISSIFIYTIYKLSVSQSQLQKVTYTEQTMENNKTEVTKKVKVEVTFK